MIFLFPFLSTWQWPHHNMSTYWHPPLCPLRVVYDIIVKPLHSTRQYRVHPITIAGAKDPLASVFEGGGWNLTLPLQKLNINFPETSCLLTIAHSVRAIKMRRLLAHTPICCLFFPQQVYILEGSLIIKFSSMKTFNILFRM